MKSSLLTAALVAVASSLATVCTFEFFRARPQRTLVDPRNEPDNEPDAVRPRAGAVPLDAALPAADRSTGEWARLIELERRIAALELGATSHRAPVSAATEAPIPNDDLRRLVLDWIAEERELHMQSAEIEAQEQVHNELELGARFDARMLASDHELPAWQEEQLALLFIEVEERRREVEGTNDVLTEGIEVEEWEARWAEFDEWAEERYQEVAARFDPAFHERVFGED